MLFSFPGLTRGFCLWAGEPGTSNKNSARAVLRAGKDERMVQVVGDLETFPGLGILLSGKQKTPPGVNTGGVGLFVRCQVELRFCH